MKIANILVIIPILFACAVCGEVVSGGTQGEVGIDMEKGAGLYVSFGNTCNRTNVIFCISNATDAVCRVVESSFPEADFNLRIKRLDGTDVSLREGAQAERIRRSEILRRLAVDIKPHSEYKREGNFISFYDLIPGSEYLLECSCRIYWTDDKEGRMRSQDLMFCRKFNSETFCVQ